jgi:DNA-binding CsgD family transcriptional regulator
MNTVVIRISETKLPDLKKFLRAAHAQMHILTNEEDIMAKLAEEGLQSETISTTLMKQEMKKYADHH